MKEDELMTAEKGVTGSGRTQLTEYEPVPYGNLGVKSGHRSDTLYPSVTVWGHVTQNTDMLQLQYTISLTVLS